MTSPTAPPAPTGAPAATNRRRAAYDIVIASDFRFPGGTSASIAQEIRAQAAAGYRTALLQVATPILKYPRPVNNKIQRCVYEGLADLVLADRPLQARLLVLRHPAAFAQAPAVRPDVLADTKLMVVNQAPFDASQDEPFYDLGAVARRIEELFGPGFVWTPIGPLVRDAVEAAGANIDLLDWDWHNILDPDEWAAERTAFAGERPVIGRHSRPHYRKWPATREDLLAAYPDDPAFDVRILGGAEVPEELLGRLPANWSVLPLNAVSAQEFLREIDFFVYFHYPGLNEAFGRAILEALAAGAVVIVPEHFRRLFGDACLYGTPADVQPLVRRLYADKAAYDAQSARGTAWVRERCSHDAHVRRVARLIGPPQGVEPAGPSRHAAPRPRLLFVTSNGGGLGHITRMLALAGRASPAWQPLFFTLSQSFGLVREQGFPVEFCPSRDYSTLSAEAWAPLFERRLLAILRTYKPAAVVFDGTNPYPGFAVAREQHPDVRFVWSRRGMWRPGMGAPALQRAADFDLVIEPGDFCAEVDRGLTATADDPVPRERVGPVTLLDEADLAGRAEAAAALGLDPERPAVLVQLADPDRERLRATLDAIVDRLRADDLQVCVPQSVTAARPTVVRPDVHAPAVYPLSRYLRAFDFAVSATGYNTFHELVRFGVPTVYIPKPETWLDDQDGRATYAEQVGVGLAVLRFDPAAFDAAVSRLLDPDRRAAMAAQARRLCPPNGAGDAIAAVERLAAGHAVSAGPAAAAARSGAAAADPTPAPADTPEGR